MEFVMVCFFNLLSIYRFPSALLVAIVTNYLRKMISEQIDLLQTVSKVILLLKLLKQKLVGGKWDEKIELCFVFSLGHLIVKRERDIVVSPAAVTPGCQCLPHPSCKPGLAALQGWEGATEMGGSWFLVVLGVHPLTDFFPEENPLFHAGVPDTEQKECGVFWNLYPLLICMQVL